MTKSFNGEESAILEQYFKEIGEFPKLSDKEESELFAKTVNGDEKAKERLIQCNLKLVVLIAKKYQKCGVSLSDLICEGNNGLLLSIEHYKANKNTRFSSYASWWIKYFIKKAIMDNGKTVRIPVSQYNRYRKIMKFINSKKRNELQTALTTEVPDSLKMRNEYVRIALSGFNVTASDQPYSSRYQNCGLYENSSSNTNVFYDNEAEKSVLHDMILRILSKLSKREESVIRKSFGIGCEKMSCKNIAKEFGLTYERIRQIKKIALEKLKRKYPYLRRELIDD